MQVTLRPFAKSDAKRLVKLANNPNVSRYLLDSFPSPYTDSDAKYWIETGSTAAGITRVIEADGVFVGCIGLAPQQGSKSHMAEIGYWLAEEFWGQGITTAAVNMMVAKAFGELNFLKLFAPVYSPNIGSIRVLEKCGFVREARMKKQVFRENQYFDEIVYVKFAPDFV